MRIWFTSDLHLGHPRVAELRGFKSVEEHDQAIMDGWCVVADDDIVWVLGDIAVHRPRVALEKMATLPGRKRLIAGNHDSIHPMHHYAYKWTQPFYEVFEFCAPYYQLRLRGHEQKLEVMLSHFPYTRDRGEEPRFAQYRLPDLGLPLVHGHVHDTSRLTNFGRELHVGVDAWNLGLVPEWQVLDLLT